jgi:hypothetical protein
MDDKADLLVIIEDELRRHPRMGPEDLRKLIAQSVFGGDHLLTDVERFRRDLRLEWEALPARPWNDATVQTIDPGGRTARLHLVGCRVAGVDLDALADLLVAQPRKAGRRTVYVRRCRNVVALAAAGRIPFDPGALSELESDGRPSHHSSGYGFASYRVLNDVTAPPVADRLRSWRLT